MKENFEKKTSKSEKSNKIVVVLLCSVLLVFAVFAGLYASGVLQIPTSTPEASEEALQKADNVTDEATLRELLAMDCELNIKVTEDIEIAETLVVNGVKKVTSDKLLKASFKLKDAAAMLDVSKKASLTIDGWNMDGNGVALGVNVNRNATFNHLDGVMEYMGTYGVVTEGVTNLSKETEISHVGEGAFKVAIEGEMNVAGGKFTDGGNYLANVEAGGVLNISGEPLFDGAVNYLVYNYGETTINGGTFLNSGYRGVTNYAKMTMEYNGDKEDGYIEVGNTENVAVYTSSTFKVSYNGVYGHDAGANVFLQSHNGSRCYVENCTFDTSKGNAVSIRGEVHFTGVDIRNAGSFGVILQQNGVATFKDVQIDNSNGRGISVESATLLGEDIRISGTGGVGIAAQVYNDIGPAKVDVSDVHLSNIQGNSIKVINGGVMEFKDSVFEISKRTSVMAENGIIKLHGVKVLGNIDKDVNVVQVQPDGDLTISGKTLITGGVMRAVAVYGGKFTMNDGEIRDNSINETGAAVHITKNGKSVGVFTMNGGSICNNTTANEIKNAGGVNVSNDAMFVMKGGRIYGNKTSGIGGGVRVAEGATFKMSGGEIYKNTSKQGGGVQVDKDATFTMTGGSIYQNETKASGAGVHVLGNFAMSGGKIYQNKATSYGGAMNIASTTDNKTKKVTAAGVLTMTGGEIYGNSAVSGGGAIQVSGNTTANISGGKITNNETGGSGDGIRVSGKVTISGDCYVGNDKVALTSKDVKLKVTGKKLTQHSAKDPLLVAVADGVSTGHVVVECDDNDAAVSLITHTASGNGSYLLAQKDKNLVVNYAAADMNMTGADTIYVSNFAELKEAVTSTTSKRYIVLGADIEMESTITVPNGTTIYIRDDGVQRTLSRKDGKTSTFFNTRYGTGIYLVGTEAGNLVLDGAISADAKAANVASLVTAQGGTIVDGVTFKNNGTEENKTLLGAFIYQKYGHLDIYDSTFTGAKAGSGAVGIATMATGYAENCVFADNTVVNGGGAIRLEKNSEFKIRDSVFENNSAGTSGGAVVSESGTFTAIDCDFRNNTAGNDGGVIKSNGGTAKFLDEDGKQNVLTANTSGKAGGAVWAKGMLEIEEYAFESNHSGLKEAANGGAIYVEGSSTNATVTNGTFTDNESLSNCGGAINNAGATLTITNTIFDGNKTTASKKNGGAIYSNNNNASTTIISSEFKNNQAKDGGAIRVTAGTIEITDSVFASNSATENGGAICTTPSDGNSVVEVTVTGSELNGNYAYNGGVIYNGLSNGRASVVNTNECIFDSNYTTGNTGGAVYIQATYTDNGSTFQNNKACDAEGNVVKNGGALYIQDKVAIATLNDSIFKSNQAKTGGAIRITIGTMIANQCDFIENWCVGDDGGAINMEASKGKVEVTLNGDENHSSVFEGNVARWNGGAIRIAGADYDSILKVTGYTFKDNKVGEKVGDTVNLAGTSGAISVTGKGSITTDSTDNIFNGNAAKNGGAIHYDSSNELKVSDWEFVENSATANGGAMYVNAGTVKLNGTGAFKGNTAVCGGAIYYNTATKSEIGAWDFVENSTTAGNGDIDEHGGAIFVNKGELHLNGQGNFTGNTAYKGGGAINVAAGSMTIKGYTFGGNVATTSDGGAIRNAATLTLEDCDFKKVNDVANQSVAKKGGAIYLTGDGSITLKGTGEFSGNTAYQAGGAIFLNSGTITAEENADYTFDGNSASTGGALYIQKGSFTAANFDFKNNIATGGNCWTGNDFGGGAIVLGQGGTTELTLTGTGEFTNNQALQSTAGGAISVMDARATLNINKDTTAEDYTYTFTGNASQNHGGAIRIVAGTVQIERVNFTTNRTEANCGGAIAASNAVLTIKNAKFDGNYTGDADGVISAKNGGAIYVDHVNADIAINNTLFNNNQAKDGGAIRITKDKQIVITDCQFTNNRAHDVAHNNGSGYGGAINMAVSGDTTSVTLNGANSFTGNKAELLGGAIYVNGTTETVGGTSVKYNSELTVNGTTFTENVARGDAGAIYAGTNAVVTVNDSSFLRNEASYDYTDDTQLSERNGNGGAIYATGNAQVTLLTQTANTYKFEGNKAVRNATEPKTFGAICANGTSVVTYSEYYVFANDNSDGANGATGDGIGKASDTATITKLATAGDYATLKLAVANAPTGVTTEITLTGNVVIEDTRIDVNSGQDVVVKNAKEISIEISRTEASASNMFNVNAGGKLKFMSNSEGGTISFDGKNVEKASMLYGRGVLELNGIVLKNGKSGNGSAVQLRNNTAQLIANDCTFESNVSTDKGGAITLTTDSGTNTYPTIQIANTKFESNICATNGGAICAEGGTIYLLGQVDFTGNKASGASDVYGGALYLKNVTLTSEPTDAMKQTGFTTSGIVNFTNNNTVTSNSNKNNNGGAIYQTGGTISLMGGGTFTGNKAGANNVNKGAGGAINTMGTVNLKNYDFTQNIAIKDGGAIRVDAATVNVENCNFVSNSAGTSAELTGNGIYNGRGGAIYLSGNDANRLNLTGTGKFESNVYTHTTDGVIKNAIYKSKGTVTGADGYTYVDNANSF